MTPRNFLFSLNQLTPDVKSFNNILYYCKEFIENNLHRIKADEEPDNEPVIPLATKAKNPRKITLPTSLSYSITQGMKLLGITSLANMASAEDLSIDKGFPNGTWSFSYCGGHDVYKCVEAYVANSTDAIMRFTLQSYAVNANKDTSDTVKVNECVAGSYDPLLELIRDIIKIPAWYSFPKDAGGGLYACTQRFKYDSPNVIVSGWSEGSKINGTKVLITGATCDTWNNGVAAIAKNCTDSFKNSTDEQVKVFAIVCAAILVGTVACGSLKLLHNYIEKRRNVDRAASNELRQPLAPES